MSRFLMTPSAMSSSSVGSTSSPWVRGRAGVGVRFWVRFRFRVSVSLDLARRRRLTAVTCPVTCRSRYPALRLGLTLERGAPHCEGAQQLRLRRLAIRV